MRRLAFAAALLLPALALAAPTPVDVVATDTVGTSQLFNANAQCASVNLAGQSGAGFFLGTGSPLATFAPSVSKDGINWTASSFTDLSGNTSASIVNPSGYQDPGIVLRNGDRFARVCTTAYTSGSATGWMIATVTAARPPAAGADVTDRAGRLLGVVYGSQGQQLQQTATNFNLRSELAVGGTLIDPRSTRALTSSDVVTANAGSGTFAVSAASLPLPTGAATAALQTTLNSLLPAALDGSGFLKVHEQGTAAVTGTVTANAGSGTMAVSAAALPLPTGAAADTSVNGLLLSQGSTTSGQKGPLHQGAVTTAAPTYTTAQTAPISLQTDGSQRVAVTNTPTVTANAGSGTFAVSAASLPLPTGAAADASVTGLQVAQGSTTSGQKGGLGLGAVTTGAPTYTTGQSSPVSLTTAGAVRTDASATTQPVSGTVTANVGTTNGLALDATLTGGSLKAKVTGNTGAALDAAGQNAASPANSLLVAGQFNTSPTTISSGNMSPLQLDSAGNVKVNVAVGGGTGGTSSTFNAASPSVGTAAGGLVTTSAPTYTTGQMGGLSLDTAGNLRVAGSFSAGAAADTAGSLVSLTTACATGSACGANTTALVAMAGQSSVNVTFSSGASPLMTVVADCSKDGGTTYLMGGSPSTVGLVIFATDAGVFSSSIVNPGNTSYTLLAPDACTHVRVRVGALTSGTVSAQLRSVTGVPDGSGFTGIPGLALGYPPLSIGLMAQDSGTSTTGRALVASANGLIVANPTAANFLVTTTPPANASSNVAQINGITPLMGNGVTGTGSQRVTISSDNTAFAVNATVTQATGTNLHAVLDTTSTTAVTQATAANLNAQVQGAAASGASKAGNPIQQGLVFNTTQPTVTTGQVVEAQATARGAQIVATGTDTFNVTVTSAPTTAVTIATLPALTTGSATIGAVTGPAAAALALDATLTGGTQKSRITGNAGAAMDAAGQNAASPANSLIVGAQFNTTPTTITTGNVSPLQMDSAGNLLVNIKAGASSGAVAQGSTTSGQTGGLIQAAVTTGAPTYTTAQTSPLSLDTAGNLRTVMSGTGNVQGLGTANSPSGGVLTVQPPSGSTVAFAIATPGATTIAANAADTAAVAATLNSACTTATACTAAQSIQWAVTGAQSAEATITAIASPVGISTACDKSYDGGVTYVLASCTFVNASSGVVKGATLANGDLVATTQYRIGWDGSPSHIRVRISIFTSGSFTVAGRAVFAPGYQPTVGAAVANGAPLNAAGSNIGQAMMAVDSAAATTGRMVRASANGVLAEVQGQAADGVTIAGNPVPVGYKSVAVASAPSTVTAGQETYGIGSIERIPYVRTFHPNLISCTVNASTATTLTALGGSCAAPGASLSIYITDITASASAAGGTAADSVPTLKSGTGGTCGTGTATVFASTQPANGGFGRSFQTPLRIAANSEVCWIDSTAGTKWINIQGFIAP